MGEISEFIKVYVEDSDVLEEKLNEILVNFTANIQDQLEPGHGYKRGDLHDSIQSDIESVSNGIGVIRAYSKLYYTPFVDEGHTLRNGEWWEGYHFMEKGLDETVAMYR